jgi:glycosyltransferase involved in cell wall biosynthesis
MSIFRNFISKNNWAPADSLTKAIVLLRQSRFFDPGWYRLNYPDLRDNPIDPARHYLEHGAREGRNPHPLFDTAFYLKENPDVAESGMNPLVHYLTCGNSEGRKPRKTHPTSNSAPRMELNTSDNANGAGPKVALRADGRRSEAPDVNDSIFDHDWYLERNPDVKAEGFNPSLHFNQFGWKEMRDPNPFFDVAWYLENNPDVHSAQINPVKHYLMCGWKERRDPGPRFSVDHYLQKHDDIREAGIEPLGHYLKYGRSEGRLIRRSTRASYARCPDLARWNVRRENELSLAMDSLADRLPKVSVLMPVYETDRRWLIRAIESVRAQFYGNFELCISDDASKAPWIRAVLDMYAAIDSRIRVHYRSENGHISRNTNDAFALSTGDIIVLLDADDELSWDALAEIALAAANDLEADFIYSDCDKISHNGAHFDPHLKPDWSPELLLTYMYAGQCLAVRRSVWETLGGLRTGYEGSQDHDFALRATELARKIVHLPRILYHWRAHGNSTALGGAQKPYSIEAGQRAVQDALDRRGIVAKARRPQFAAESGVSFFEINFQDQGPKVSIVIPTFKNIVMLRRCVESLKRTNYRNYEVVIVGDDSVRKEMEPEVTALGQTVLWAPRGSTGFNFSRKMNWAVQRVSGDLVVLLNDDTEVVNPSWLSSMVGYSAIPGVGIVGALLRFPDGRVQHAGIISGMEGGRCGISFRLAQPSDRGYCSLVSAARNCAAVTAACMLVSRQLYQKLGGLDETTFAVAYNDPDFCYRAHDAGYRIVYTPQAELTHHEGASRGFVDNPDELAAYLDRYRDRRDPYFNRNFARSDGNYRVKPTNVSIRRSMKVPVAFVSHNMNWEGAPRHLFNLVAALKESGSVDPVVFSLGEGPLMDAYAAVGVAVITFPDFPGWQCGAKAYKAWIEIVRNEFACRRVRAIFANTLECFFAVDAATALDIPSLWNIHESEGEAFFSGWSYDIQQTAMTCFKRPYRLVFVCDATAAVYAHLDENDVSIVIKNGYLPPPGEAHGRATAREKLGLSPDAVVFLSVGTVCKRKGQLDIVSALARVDPDLIVANNFAILICGDRRGGYSEELHHAVSRLPEQIRRCVQIISETGDVALYYSAADVFVCPSRMESYPTVIMEAMGAGLAIITTPVFGITEQVREGGNALFFQPADCKTLALQITRLLCDHELRSEMGHYSKAQLRTLPSLQTMIDDYETNILEGSTASVFHS